MRKHRGLLRRVDRSRARRRAETVYMLRPPPQVWVYPNILTVEFGKNKQPGLVVFTN